MVCCVLCLLRRWHEDILRWALLTAYPEYWQVLLDAPLSTDPRDYLPLISSKSFAKAFWGEDWEEHRWQPLCHSDKLADLARFL
jgi:hypothetical protein